MDKNQFPLIRKHCGVSAPRMSQIPAIICVIPFPASVANLSRDQVGNKRITGISPANLSSLQPAPTRWSFLDSA